MKIWFKFFFMAVLLNTGMFINTTDYDSDIYTFQIKRDTENSVQTATLKSADTTTIETATTVTTTESADKTETEIILDSSNNDETTIPDSSTTQPNIIFPMTNSEYVNTVTNAEQIISNSLTNIETITPESSTKTNELKINLNMLEKETTYNEFTIKTNKEHTTINYENLDTHKTEINDETLIPENPESSTTIIDLLSTSKQFLTTNLDDVEIISNSSEKSDNLEFKFTIDTFAETTNSEINIDEEIIVNSSVVPALITVTEATNSELNVTTTNEDATTLINPFTNHEIQSTALENVTSKSELISSIDNDFFTTTETTNSELNNVTLNEDDDILLKSATNHEIHTIYPENVTSKSEFNSSVNKEILVATGATNPELNNRTLNEDEESLLNSATTHEIQTSYPENTTTELIFNSSIAYAVATEATNSELNVTATNKDTKMLLNNNFQDTDSKNASTLENLNYATVKNSGTETPLGKYYSLLDNQTAFEPDQLKSKPTENASTTLNLSVSTDDEKPEESTPTYTSISTEVTTSGFEETPTSTDIPSTTTDASTTLEPYICLEPVKIENLFITEESYSLYLRWPELPSEYDECNFEYFIEWDVGEDYTSMTEYDIVGLTPCEDYKISITVIWDREAKPINEPVRKIGRTKDIMQPVENLKYDIMDGNSLYIHWNLPKEVLKCFKNYRFTKYEDNKLSMSIDYYANNITFYEVDGCINNTYEVITYSEKNLTGSSSISYLKPTLNDPPVFSYERTEIQDDIVITRWSYGKFVCRPESFYVFCKEDKKPEFTVKGEFHHNELCAKLEKIYPYTNYTCFGIISNEAGNSSRSEPGSFLTKSKPPDVPEKIIITEIDNTYLNIKWEPPKNWNGEKKEYNISIEYIKLNYDLPKYCTPSSFEHFIDTLDATITEYNFSTIIPASKYKISVKAKSDGGWGKEKQENIDLEEDTPNKPEIDHIGFVSSTSLNLTWHTPCKIHGVLKHYNIKLLGRKDNCEPDLINENYTPGPGETDYHTKILENLRPGYTYRGQLLAENQKLIGEAAEILFLTPSGPPELPQNITIFEYEDYLNIQWKPPNKWNGKEKHYNVSVEYLKLNYNLSINCTPISVRPYSEILTAAETEFNFSSFIIPASKYRISIKAESDGGWGEETEDLFDLKETYPEEPSIFSSIMTNQTSKNYNTSLQILWREPCEMNGILEFFHIKLLGEKLNFEPDCNKEENIPSNNRGFYEEIFINLKPDYNYTLEIQAVNTYPGKIAVKSYLTPAGSK